MLLEAQVAPRGAWTQGVALYVHRGFMELGAPKLDGSKISRDHSRGREPTRASQVFMPSVAAANGFSRLYPRF